MENISTLLALCKGTEGSEHIQGKDLAVDALAPFIARHEINHV